MLTENCMVQIVKGCRARGVNKGTSCRVTKIEHLGPDYGCSVKVVIALDSRTSKVFYVKHKNRLADPIVRMNTGNPLQTIEVKLK